MAAITEPRPQSPNDPKKRRWIKIALIIAFLIATIFIWYLTIPGLLIAWFLRTKRVSKKAKVISSITAGVLFLVLCVSMSVAYYKDPTPALQIQEPTNNATIKGHTVMIRGTYQPSDRKIWINDKEITVSGGQFEYTYDLNLGSNTITVSAGNWKRVKQELHITRALTDEEVAIQQKAEQDRLAAEQAKQEADAKAKADQEAQRKAAEEQAKLDADAKTKAEQEEQARIDAEEQAKRDAEAKAQAEEKAKQEAEDKIKNAPAEYKSALNKATSYANVLYMSKRGVYDQLVSEYGEQFSTEAAQFAIDNVKADWNANALVKAKSYQSTMNMSPAAIHDQLTSEYGEKFTQAEADYAIQHLND